MLKFHQVNISIFGIKWYINMFTLTTDICSMFGEDPEWWHNIAHQADT